MVAKQKNEVVSGKSETTIERRSERELVITRTFQAPARIVFEAWSKPELFIRWWLPNSFGITIVSSEMDIRTGGAYRLVMKHPSSDQPMAFFGRYLEVTERRMVWTNDENVEGAVTTVTFEEKGDTTFVTVHDLYPSKEALDEAIASGSTGGFPEQFAQLDILLAG